MQIIDEGWLERSAIRLHPDARTHTDFQYTQLGGW